MDQPARSGLRKARAVRPHEIPARAPIQVAVGDELDVEERSEEWPEFVFVRRESGCGWVPGRHLSGTTGRVRVLTPYDTTELPTEADALLEVLEEDLQSAWLWCRDEGGREGWVPISTLAPID